FVICGFSAKEWWFCRIEGSEDAFGGEDLAEVGFEGALVFLAEPAFADDLALFREEVARDAGAVPGGHADALPEGVEAFPGVVEPAALAEWRREADEPPARDREH